MRENYFTDENLKGEFSSFVNEVRRGTPTAVFGVSDGMKYLLASLLPYPVVYITADASGANKARDDLATLTGKKVCVMSAKDEVLLYRKALSKDSLFRRIEGLYNLQKGGIVTAEIDSLLGLFPKKMPVLTLREGEDADFSNLTAILTDMGYTRSFEVESRGVFALRGDILDIYPVGSENPVRVDFFGDTVEKIKPYDFETGTRRGTLDEIVILPATDQFLTDGDAERIEFALKSGLKSFKTSEAYSRANGIADELLSDLRGEKSAFLMPLTENGCDFFSVIPENTVLVFDEGKTLYDKFNALYKEHEERYHRLADGGEAFPFSLSQFIGKDRFLSALDGVRRVALQTFSGNPFFFSPLKIFNMPTTPVSRYLNGVPALLTDLKNWQRGGYRVLLFCGEENKTSKMSEILTDEYLSPAPLSANLDTFKGIGVVPEYFAKGFVLHDTKLAVIGTGDLYTKPNAEKRVKRKRGDMFGAPEVGDFAVHETHGIGRVVGTKKIETTDGTKEYVALEYKDGDVLYVPVEHMDSLSKYVGDSPALSKIGGADFERVKARVRASIKNLAFDLKKLYAERAESRGFRFPENEVFMQEFEDAFPHDLTPDQASSVEEIKRDMCSDKVMDRLLCGDVGFGKTEVAFRAIFLCILGGKQAVLMCPSTVLCNQHFNTALARFSDFGVKVGVLNRFESPKEQAETLKGVADGTIDLLIGTHRVLSSDVRFKNLGLLVLDEEQRFGVEHKEKIKNLRKDVDCLTMTATPIPRTLHMSLTGIRDISTIQTAPGERLPVQTYVVEETETLIRDACIRELSRDGQVFILYNRVESIYTFAEKIKSIIPEGRFSVVHGRMEKTVLENGVYDFYSGKTNILITTTIIENGIDLPNANTLIVIDSDKLGISQLYQLKGRVGRGTRLAHAYFTYKAEKVMTSNATERLKAIMEFTELGSGYKLAVRDLEIRGAGNVLGAEQHGHMDKVGYELYAKLLKEEITGETLTSPELDIRTDAFISENYVESSAGRLDTYKQIAEIRTTEDYKRVYESLEETYGPLPAPVINLLVVSVLKSYASRLNVVKITVQQGLGALEFSSVQKMGDERVQSALEKYKDKIRLNMSQAPVMEFYTKKAPVEIMAEMTKFLKFALTFK